MQGDCESRQDSAVDILGIGVQKSATSWAAHVLNLHPLVWFPEQYALSGKEVRFFDTNKWRNGLDWYREIMTPPDPRMLSADVSPGYSRAQRDRVRVCHRIAPSARVFLLLRDPVYRDWSSIVMEAQGAGVDVAGSSFIDLMVFYDAKRVDQFTTYVRTVNLWREFYDEQLLIMLYDDVKADPEGACSRLYRHVGLEVETVPNWRAEARTEIFKGPGTPLRADMGTFLAKKYRPMVDRLEDLVGRDLSEWRHPALEQEQATVI